MNAISTMTYTNDACGTAYAALGASQPTWGLGPNQLDWLRRNIDSFKQAEDQRLQMRHDVVRAARMAGLL
jgi:hypothetical protein